jgi:hypothetical protein
MAPVWHRRYQDDHIIITMISKANRIHKKNDNFHWGIPSSLRPMLRGPLPLSRSRLRGRRREAQVMAKSLV